METSVAQLKAHLSEVLAEVQNGKTFEVLKGNKPVARLVPCHSPQPSQPSQPSQRFPPP